MGSLHTVLVSALVGAAETAIVSMETIGLRYADVVTVEQACGALAWLCGGGDGGNFGSFGDHELDGDNRTDGDASGDSDADSDEAPRRKREAAGAQTAMLQPPPIEVPLAGESVKAAVAASAISCGAHEIVFRMLKQPPTHASAAAGNVFHTKHAACLEDVVQRVDL